MAGNVAASMTASIIIDKKEIVSSALAAYADAQKELDGNKLELLIDVSDDKAIEKVRALQKELGSKEYIIKFNNQGLEETLKSIDELGNRLKDLISGKLTGNGKGIGNSLVDEQQLKTIIDLFEKMESHLDSMRKVFSDVGDGEEFSPLLQTIKNVESAVKSLDTTFKDIGFNMNIDVGSNSELENQLQSKISNALSAYERLFEHIKMSNAGDDMLMNNFFGFDINQFDTTMAKVQAYRTFIENQKKDYQARHDYPGATDAYVDTDKKYWNQVSSAMGEITKVQNKIKASGDTSALDSLFGKTDLTEVISGLNQIVLKLDEIIASANELKNTLGSGLKIEGATSEIADLTNRFKELEDELSKLKVGNNSSADSSSSSQSKKGGKKSADAQLNDDWEAAIKLNNALNITSQRYEDLGKSSQSLAQTDGYKKLQDDLQKFNNELTSGSISLDRYNSKVDSAFNKLDQRMEKNRETVKKFTNSSVNKLSDAIAKYSYGDTTDATALMNKLSGGVTNFKDLTNVSGELEKFKSQVKEVIDTLKQSHTANLKGLNDDIAKEAEAGTKAYDELNDAISRYCALKIKEVKGKALPGDLDELNALDTKIQSIMKTKGNGLLNNEQIDSSQKRLDELNQSLEYLVKNLAAVKEKSTASSLAKDLATYETEVSKAQEKLASRSTKPAEGQRSNQYEANLTNMRQYVDEMITLQNKMAESVKQGVSPAKEDIEAFNKLKTQVEGCEQAFKNMSAAEKGASEMSRDKLFNKIGDYLQKNSGMAKEFKVQLQALQKELSMRGADANVADLTDKFLKLQIQIREAGQEGRSFLDVLKDKAWYGAIGQIATYFSFNDIIRYGGEAAKTVVNLNTKITELAKVSEDTTAKIYKDFKSYADIAKDLGGTISDAISATADWSRNGYNIPDSKELTRVALLYKNVGDGINIDQANESLISTLRGFRLEAEDALHIIDVFNEVKVCASHYSNIMALCIRYIYIMIVAISVKIQRWTRPRKDCNNFYFIYGDV